MYYKRSSNFNEQIGSVGVYAQPNGVRKDHVCYFIHDVAGFRQGTCVSSALALESCFPHTLQTSPGHARWPSRLIISNAFTFLSEFLT
jgi:hypothetical protein